MRMSMVQYRTFISGNTEGISPSNTEEAIKAAVVAALDILIDNLEEDTRVENP
jgi:hypothetical protein